MLEKVIFDTHSHGIEETEEEEINDNKNEISMVNVNNNYNINLPSINKLANSSIKHNAHSEINVKSIKMQSSKFTDSKKGSFSICIYYI